MEVFGAFLDEEWESLSKMFSFEDSDFMLHCDGNTVFSNEYAAPGDNVTAVSGNDLFLPSDNTNNFYCVSQERSNSSELGSALLAGRAGDEGTYDNTFEPMEFFCQQNNDEGLMLPVFADDVMNDIIQLRDEMWIENLGNAGNAGSQTAENGDFCMEMQLKRRFEAPEIHAQDDSSENPKKEPRVSRDTQKNKKNTQSKRNKKAIQISNDEEVNNACGNGQSSSTCCSEADESNISDSKVSASNGKTKANKGPATDPQSLYARKRRERINERLRILQNLVPNGTKVDISTMLEEAVHYVKFLQLQIKLLSSDDMWMYAPIAYNGMDIGLYQKIVPTQN